MDGPACFGLTAIDAVTAEGERIHADDESDPELMWAARGSGPGFFAAVTRMYLELKPLPASMLGSLYIYPLEVLDEFLEWILPATLAAPENVSNLWASVESFLPQHDGTIIAHFPTAFSDSEATSRTLLEPFENSPLLEHALVHQPPQPWSWDTGYALVDRLYQEGFRYRSDALWVKTDDDSFLEPLKDIVRSLPNSHSHVLWAPWRERQHPNAAYSLDTPLSIHVYGVGSEIGEDDSLEAFVREAMLSLEPYSIRGGKVNNHDLVSFPKYVLGPDETQRLRELKAKRDPADRFHTYLGTPEPVRSG